MSLSENDYDNDNGNYDDNIGDGGGNIVNQNYLYA